MTARNNPWLDELAANVQKQNKIEFDRDWLILAARQDRYSVTEIAGVVGLTRQQVHRIIAKMTAVLEGCTKEKDLEDWEVYDIAWGSADWTDFNVRFDS